MTIQAASNFAGRLPTALQRVVSTGTRSFHTPGGAGQSPLMKRFFNAFKTSTASNSTLSLQEAHPDLVLHGTSTMRFHYKPGDIFHANPSGLWTVNPESYPFRALAAGFATDAIESVNRFNGEFVIPQGTPLMVYLRPIKADQAKKNSGNIIHFPGGTQFEIVRIRQPYFGERFLGITSPILFALGNVIVVSLATEAIHSLVVKLKEEKASPQAPVEGS